MRPFGGSAANIIAPNRDAFSLPFPGMARERLPAFAEGRLLFRQSWIVAPAQDDHVDGLGPTYNRLSCGGCHPRNGRGEPPEGPGDVMRSQLVRLSVPGDGPHGGPKPHPAYGDQLNPDGIPGVPGEGRATVIWHERSETLGAAGEGETVALRWPELRIDGPAFGPPGPEVMTSIRVAPPVFGLGLLEAVPEQAILELADPDDRNGDGISGRPNRVWDAVHGSERLGRFGWKANTPTLEQQIAGAFLGDMGITSPLFPVENCPEVQSACRAAPTGGTPELARGQLDAVVLYHRLLAVPAPRDQDDPMVARGRALFAAAGCAACHTPSLPTDTHAALSELAGLTIHPYTDLLLHDLGEALADNRPDFRATGREWRTPPLWGLGLLPLVNGHSMLLHDGRARSVLEAILWHGGEAAAAREAVRILPAADRAALLTFLSSL